MHGLHVPAATVQYMTPMPSHVAQRQQPLMQHGQGTMMPGTRVHYMSPMPHMPAPASTVAVTAAQLQHMHAMAQQQLAQRQQQQLAMQHQQEELARRCAVAVTTAVNAHHAVPWSPSTVQVPATAVQAVPWSPSTVQVPAPVAQAQATPARSVHASDAPAQWVPSTIPDFEQEETVSDTAIMEATKAILQLGTPDAQKRMLLRNLHSANSDHAGATQPASESERWRRAVTKMKTSELRAIFEGMKHGGQPEKWTQVCTSLTLLCAN